MLPALMLWLGWRRCGMTLFLGLWGIGIMGRLRILGHKLRIMMISSGVGRIFSIVFSRRIGPFLLLGSERQCLMGFRDSGLIVQDIS
jgi:hypothetical protein